MNSEIASKAERYSNGVRILVGFSVLLLGGWVFANLFSALSYVAAQGDEEATRNLGHAFCVIIGVLWALLALQFDLSSFKYNHLSKLFHLPWSFRQLYFACLLRSLCDIWILFWISLILWWALNSGPGFTVLGWATVLFSNLLFAMSMVSWIHVIRTAIERSVYSRIYKWAVRLVLAGLFVGGNYASIATNFKNSNSVNTDASVSGLNVADYTVAMPPGLLAEIIHAIRGGDASSAGFCVAALFAFVLTGWHFGIGMTKKTMRETGSTRWMTKSRGNSKSLFESLSDPLARMVPIGYALFMTQEFVYLLRWNRVRITVAFFLILIPSYLITVAPRAPQLLGIFPWYFCMMKFMFSYLNKDGKAVWHNYLLPFDKYKVIVGKNAALLLLQYLINVISSSVILPLCLGQFELGRGFVPVFAYFVFATFSYGFGKLGFNFQSIPHVENVYIFCDAQDDIDRYCDNGPGFGVPSYRGKFHIRNFQPYNEIRVLFSGWIFVFLQWPLSCCLSGAFGTVPNCWKGIGIGY